MGLHRAIFLFIFAPSIILYSGCIVAQPECATGDLLCNPGQAALFIHKQDSVSGRWLALGGTDIVLSDLNADKWTLSGASGTLANTLVSLSRNDERWLGVGNAGHVAYSADGLNGNTWQVASGSGVTASLQNAVASTQSSWCSVGNSGTILRSTDDGTGDAWAISASSGAVTGGCYSVWPAMAASISRLGMRG